MEDLTLALLLYVIGIALLVLEIFIPSHGVLGLSGLGFLIGGIVVAFRIGQGVGYVAVFLAIVLVPTGAVLAVKYWYQTPVGRRIAPPNPTITEAKLGFRTEELAMLVGQTGRTLTPLRPVGSCDFGGKRIQCVAEVGRIARGVKVEGVMVRGRDLVVRPVQT
jgi:membrane-bound serine protease (ClpP class)